MTKECKGLIGNLGPTWEETVKLVEAYLRAFYDRPSIQVYDDATVVVDDEQPFGTVIFEGDDKWVFILDS